MTKDTFTSKLTQSLLNVGKKMEDGTELEAANQEKDSANQDSAKKASDHLDNEPTLHSDSGLPNSDNKVEKKEFFNTEDAGINIQNQQEPQQQEPQEHRQANTVSRNHLETLIIDFYNEPDLHRDLTSRQAALPKGLTSLLENVSNQITLLMTSSEAIESGGVELPRDDDLIKATVFFVKRVFLISGADHYRVLGLNPKVSADDVHRHYRYLRRLFWSDNKSESAQANVMRISEAYVELRDPQRRSQYNERLHGRRGSVYIDETIDVSAKYATAETKSKRNKGTSKRGTSRRGTTKVGTSKSLPRPALYIGIGLIVFLGGGTLYWLQNQNGSSGVDETELRDLKVELGEEKRIESTPIIPDATEEIQRVETDAGGGEDQSLISQVEDFVSETLPSTLDSEVDVTPSIDEVSAEDTTVTGQIPSGDSGVEIIPLTPNTNRESSSLDGGAELGRIDLLLARAQVLLNDSRLTQPAGNNAYELYRRVLDLEPNNKMALAGMRRIADRYVGLVRYRMNRDRYSDAQAMLVKGLAVSPDHEVLLLLETEIQRRMNLAADAETPSVSEGNLPLDVDQEASVTTDDIFDSTLGSEGDAADVSQQEVVELEVEQGPQVVLTQVPGNEAASDSEAEDQTTFVDVVEPPAVAAQPLVEPEPKRLSLARPQASAPQVAGPFSDIKLSRLIDNFVDNYERGNLDAFLELFSDDAKTNNRTSKIGIRKDYESLFAGTSSRLMRIRNVKWSRGDGQAVGDADFNLTVIKGGGSRPRSYDGTLTFQVAQQDGALVIVGLFHSQRKLQRQ